MLIQASIEHLPLEDDSIDLIFTDPPYPTEYLRVYNWLAREAFRVLRPGGFVIAMAGGINLNRIYRFFDDSGLSYHFELNQFMQNDATIVWPRGMLAKAKPILCYSKGPSKPRCLTMNVFDAGTFGKEYHHWGQDVESARYYVDCFSCPGQLVLDPFLGGGTTGVACELIGRRWIGCDIDPNALATTALRLSGARIPSQAPMLI